MPRRDGTGPMGQGMMTGRGMGNCNVANSGFYGTGMGRGAGFRIGRRACLGMGNGMGLGYGCRKESGEFYSVQPSGMTDKEILTQEKEFLKKRLDFISKQLDENTKDDE